MKTVIKYLIITGVLYLALSCTTQPSGGPKTGGNTPGGATPSGIPPIPPPKTFPVPSREVRSWKANSGGGTICFGNCLAFTPDGQVLASGSYDKTVKLWQVSTGQLLNTLSGHTGWVTSVAVSPDGRLLASSSKDKTIKLWQVSTGQLLKTLSGHKWGVTSVAFSPNNRLVSGDGEGVIKLWE